MLCKIHHAQNEKVLCVLTHLWKEKEVDVTKADRKTVVTKGWEEQGKARLRQLCNSFRYISSNILQQEGNYSLQQVQLTIIYGP